MNQELCFTGARELVASIRARTVSAREVMTVFLAQIDRLNPKINAIVARLPDERCLALAEEEPAGEVRGRDGPFDGVSNHAGHDHGDAAVHGAGAFAWPAG